MSKVPLSARFSAIATVTGAVAARAAMGRLAASMLDTAITSSIRTSSACWRPHQGWGVDQDRRQHRP